MSLWSRPIFLPSEVIFSMLSTDGSTLPLCTLAARSESEATISFWISEGCTTTVSNFASGTGRSS